MPNSLDPKNNGTPPQNGGRKSSTSQHQYNSAFKKKPSLFLKFVESGQRASNDAALYRIHMSGDVSSDAVVNAFGQLFYFVGLQTEYLFVRFGRSLRSFFSIIIALFTVAWQSFIKPSFSFLLAILIDVFSPIIHIFYISSGASAARKNAKKQGKRAGEAAREYYREEAALYRRTLQSAATYFLPVITLVLFAAVALPIITTDYSLEVEYKGEKIAYIENDAVWDKAQMLINSRIKAASDAEPWAALPVFHLSNISPAARSSASDLADKIVEKSTNEFQKAFGLYIDGALIGIVTDNTRLQNYLQTVLEKSADPTKPNSTVEFVSSIETVPGLYFTSSLRSNVAVEENLEKDKLLKTRIVERIEYNAALPYETISEKSDKYYKGTTKVTQYGKDGTKHVVADVVYMDGVEVERRILEETITEEAIPKIQYVGTKENIPTYGNIGAGSGGFIFPVPGYSGFTTQFGGASRHRGLDITGPYGTPIYACAAGSVVESGYHYSWGYYVKVDHGNGYTTLYAHNSQNLVAAGQSVAAGQAIALMGSTGYSTGNHLHLEFAYNGSLVNPRQYIG